jgi:hypothetical protein
VEFAKGKVWKTLGQLKGHLSMFRTIQGVNQVPLDWQVIEVALTPVGQPQNARDMVQASCDKQYKRMHMYKNRYEKEQADREKAELKRLLKKYQPGHAPGHE